MIENPTQADYWKSPSMRKELVVWHAWERGYGRCPYCVGLPAEDWACICDCFMTERVLGYSNK